MSSLVQQSLPTEMKDRIRKIRKENHLSQVEFAKKLNVSQSVISLIESGNASVSIEIVKRLSAQFDLSCDWLIYGQEKYTRLSVQNNFIPLVNGEAEAGYISNADDPKYSHTLSLYKLPGFENGEYRIFIVEGDSMVPVIHPHDKIVCEKVPAIEALVEGTLNVVVSKAGIVVKRTYFWEKDKNFIVLKSENQHYTEERVPVEDVLEVWSVRAKLTTSFLDQSHAHNERMDSLERELGLIRKQVGALANHSSGLTRAAAHPLGGEGASNGQSQNHSESK